VDYGSPRFDALDVRYIVTAPTTDLSDIPGLRLVHESETRVWENTDNAGRAFVVGQALDLLHDPPAALAAARPAETALLEVPPPAPLGGKGTASVLADEGSLVRVQAECDGPALLVLAVSRGPGWTASVDGGDPRPTLACDVAWQAVELPQGRHEVEFRLDSPALRWGVVISALAGVVWLLLLILPRQLS
jgi:hypothetical protein